MSWWVDTKLRPDGELSWARDRGDDTQLADLWMELITFQKWGIEQSDIDALGGQP